MNFHLKYPLHDLLTRAIAGDYSPDQLGELHKLAYIIARGYVRMRGRNGQLPLHLLGMCESDVVHDSIAEVFTRSATGELVEISRYFRCRNIAPRSVPEAELTVHLRNLVFAVAGDNVFRMLNEADPALGKIIRNIKLAAKKSEDWTIETRFEDKVLALRNHDGASHRDGIGSGNRLTVLPDDQFEPAVTEAIAGHREIPALMSCLANKLRNSGLTGGPLPIVSLAVMLKKGFERHHVTDSEPREGDSMVGREDLLVAIGDCCLRVDRSMRGKYVGKGKVTKEVFSGYVDAIRKYLEGDLTPGRESHPAGNLTYYDSLHAVLPSLSREDYLRNHRPVFEYLARQVKTCLRDNIYRN